MATRVILVRHGQTAWNRDERFRGRADVPLDKAGLAQVRATGKRVADQWSPVAVYSSPLTRALTTAEAIASLLALTVVPDAGLIDIDYGEWQGLTPEAIRQRWPKELEAWSEAPATACIPSGEKLEDVRGRAMASLRRICAAHEGRTVCVVAHHVVNRLILLDVLGLGNERFWHLRQDTCAVNIFEAEAGDFTLVSLNDTCHLRQG
jgi:broad specificity phosphatase PhoE